MRDRAIAALIAGLLSGCATAPQLHHGSQLRRDAAYICLAPDGTDAREVFDDSGGVTCPAPARFVSQPFCETVPKPPRDVPGYYRARGLAARDGSLVGDRFEGQPFCVVRKSGPPLPSQG